MGRECRNDPDPPTLLLTSQDSKSVVPGQSMLLVKSGVGKSSSRPIKDMPGPPMVDWVLSRTVQILTQL